MRIPVATYRLQVNDEFTLRDARAILPYLARLGISDIYLSPVFEARRGTAHGYDVTDPTRIRESIGGLEALRALAGDAHARHMGILLDIVPNHMGASVENPWWRDVLSRGRDSEWADFFDIDWGANGERRLRLPILGEPLAVVLERDELAVDAEAGELVYYETRLPLAPGSLGAGAGPAAHGASAAASAAGDIAALLERQHYELVHWRTASEYMSYRRFFDITDLAALRVEEDRVFRASHQLIRDLAAEGTITGLRIDHIDGLRDPTGYLQRLRAFVRGPEGAPVYTVVEKILERSEVLPAEWECEGTTGYEFLNLATGLLVEPGGHAAIDLFYRRLTGNTRDFGMLVREKKLLVLDRLFGAELNALTTAFATLSGLPDAVARRAIAELTVGMRVYRTYTRDNRVRAEDRARIEEAFRDAARHVRSEPDPGAVPAALEQLRDFVLLEGGAADEDARLDWVMRWQQFTGPVMAKGFEDTALYCHNALLAANDVGSDPEHPCLSARELHAALAQRLNDAPFSLNATATHDTKRGEDTRARIAVLSEMPGDWRNRLRQWSRAGDEWKAELTDDDDDDVPSSDVESLLYQTLLGAWPLHGADDQFAERIKAYMTKAVREAKEQTSWRRPDEDYEESLRTFVELLMAEVGREGLAEDIAGFAAHIAPYGALNSLAQMLLKITAPGIPDVYQGTELWALTLVDPDNRQPVDYEERRRLLDDVARDRDTPDAAYISGLLASWPDGRIKLLLTALALRFRAMHREVFEHGDVIELSAAGSAARHIFAFARRAGDRAVVVVLPRWTAVLARASGAPGVLPAPTAWGDTTLTMPAALGHVWHNALTGESCSTEAGVRVADLFAALPFALLEPSQPIGA